MQRWLLAGLILLLGMSWTGLWSVEILAKLEAAGPTAAATDLDIDGNLRLDRSVVPTHYSLDLTIDPTKDRFSGKVAIRVQLSRETSLIRLHGQDMNFAQTAIESEGKRLPVHVVKGKNGGIALIVDPPLPAGQATIHLSYDAPFSPVLAGLYRVEDRSQWYAFTQFEALDARRAFPGFDQPEFKTSYAVTMRVPEGIIALTNGSQQKRHTDGQSQVFTFAETKPLPTYLVAFAVGPFDVVAGPENAAGKPPLRIITTQGKGKLAAFALKRTPLILQWLSDYFGQPYPFAKLDQVAVPNFGGGAMENVGLVTYRERLLLLDETQAPIRSRLLSQTVIAHELSHMWYGNLVTMPWWDDLWLNEAFASWMAPKVIADIDPELEVPLEAVAREQGVMDLDSKRDARAIRQPIRHGGDIRNASDGITYRKGSAVLRMTEAWIGETAFRDGVRAYMQQHAYGSGATADLLAALDNASGKPVAETVRLFLDQPGTPLVDVTLSCDQEQKQPAALLLKQRRYRVAGSDVPEGKAWTIPVCVRYGFAAEGEREAAGHRECFLLDGRQLTVTLSQPGCPVWLHPNADEQGYYRWRLQPEVLSSVVNQHRQELSLVERVVLPGQLLALLRAAQARPRFNAAHQYLLSRGIAVFDLNFRGSVGSGKRYARLNDRRLREHEIYDLADAIDWLRKEGKVDAESVAVMGRSYGGYLTMAAVARIPEYFSGGVAFVGVSNWVTALEGASPQLKASDRIEYGDISNPKDRKFFLQISPITHVANVKAPVMVLHGANDPRDPVAESDQFVRAIREQSGEIQYLRFPDEGHGIRKLSNRIIAYRRIAAFLEGVLQVKSEAVN